jgi:hypothetical protein
LERFRKMLKAGVPEEAVHHKMRKEGLDPAQLSSKAAKSVSDTKAPGDSSSESASETVVPDPLERFRKMLKAGVPEEAVHHKMRKEGLDPAQLSRVLGEEQKSASIVDQAKLKKYQVFLNAVLFV